MRYVLVVLGLVLMCWGFVYDASVPSGEGFGAVMNLGRIAEKQMIFGFGAVLFLAGMILLGAKGIEEVLRGPAAKPELKPEDFSPGYTVGPTPKKKDFAEGQY